MSDMTSIHKRLDKLIATDDQGTVARWYKEDVKFLLDELKQTSLEWEDEVKEREASVAFWMKEANEKEKELASMKEVIEEKYEFDERDE